MDVNAEDVIPLKALWWIAGGAMTSECAPDSAKSVDANGRQLKWNIGIIYTAKVIRMLNFYEGHKVYMNGDYPAIFLNGENQHIHRLEWIKHHGEIPTGCIIHHKDENKTNWNIDNLELLTRGEHVLQHQHSLHTDDFVKYGEESRHHKLTQAEVNYIRSHYIKYDTEFGGRSLAKQFGVTEACVSKIVKCKSWKVVV